jgi:TonB family protein
VSRTRVVFSLTGMFALLVAAAGVTVWSLPLRAEPVFAPAQADSSQPPQRIRVGGNVQHSKLIEQVRPKYPPLAKQARIQGTVRLRATIAKDGSVRDLEVVSGHPLLVESALEAVRQWRYRQTLLNGEPVEVITMIDVNFTLEGGGAEAAAQAVESPGFSLEEPEQPTRIRVGAAVEQRKLLYSPEPVYPPLAEQARIQGTVRLEVLIAADGAVKQVRLISGHPLLAGAVLEAVKKWRYRPTLLDGEPVEVVTQIEVRLPPGAAAPEAEGAPAYRVGADVKQPVLIHKVEPVYTQEARDAKLEGKVVALIEVGADGVIRNVEIVKPLGLGLDEKAVEALRQWRFQPAEKDGQPVAVKATIEMNFRLY